MKVFLPTNASKKALQAARKRIRQGLKQGEVLLICKNPKKNRRDETEEFLLKIAAQCGAMPLPPWRYVGKSVETLIMKGKQ